MAINPTNTNFREKLEDCIAASERRAVVARESADSFDQKAQECRLEAIYHDEMAANWRRVLAAEPQPEPF